MSRRDWTHAQRVVIVVAIAAMLVVVGRWITSLGSPGHFTGWTGFAPLQNTAPLFPGAGLHAWARVLVWLILIAVWATVSLIVLKDESNSDHDVPSP